VSRFLGGMHKCAVLSCRCQIQRGMTFCDQHYGLLPAWLQRKLRDERAYGVAWKCHPTDKFLELRAQAITLATREAARRHGKPDATQLPLLPAS
jgi:hypothetical protein